MAWRNAGSTTGQPLRQACASTAGQAARADADAHVARRERLALTEHTILAHPAPPRFKFAAGLKRRADMSQETFGHWWGQN
jgi:hypothetical protein